MSTPFRIVPLRMLTGGAIAVHGFARLFGGPGTADRLPDEAYRYLGKEYRDWMEGGGMDNFSRQLESLGVPSPQIAAYVIAGTEFFGGLLFALGRLTPIVGLALAADIGASLQKVYGKNGMVGGGGWELPGLQLAAVITVLLNEP